MRKIHVKVRFPFNGYGLRKLGLYFDNHSKETIMPNQTRVFEIDECSSCLKIKIDFFQSKIKIPEGAEDAFITIGIKGANPVNWLLNSFHRNGLEVTETSKSKFESFDSKYIKSSTVIAKLDSVSITLTSALNIYFGYLLFSKNHNIPESIEQLLVATIIISSTALFVLIKDKKTISEWSYQFRMMSDAILLFIVIIVLSNLQLIKMGWIIALIPVLIFMRTLSWKNSISRTK